MPKLGVGRMPPTDGVDKYHLPVGGGVTIHGNTKESLIKNVFEYRLRNNIPIGDIDADIDSFYCEKYPSFCHDEKAGIGKSTKAKAQEMLNRVSQWASTAARKMPRGGWDLATTAEAERRAAICVQCSQNGGWRSGCGGCDAVTFQLLQGLKKMHTTGRDGNLSACRIGGFELSTAVHMPAEATPITAEQREQMPTPCWRKVL